MLVTDLYSQQIASNMCISYLAILPIPKPISVVILCQFKPYKKHLHIPSLFLVGVSSFGADLSGRPT